VSVGIPEYTVVSLVLFEPTATLMDKELSTFEKTPSTQLGDEGGFIREQILVYNSLGC